MNDYTPRVAVYRDGVWHLTVTFKKKWHAYLFHHFLNLSRTHEGMRQY